MLIREVDRRLDMRLILRLRQETGLFKATADFDKPLPVFIFDQEDKVFMNTYFPKRGKYSSLDITVRKFGGVELEDSYVTTTRINNVRDMMVVKKLTSLPSVVVNRADMSSGFLNLYTRFHSSQLDRVSSLLGEYITDKENSRIEWLGPSPGIIAIMDLIDSQYPVSVVTYELDIPEGERVMEVISKLDCIAEVQGASSEGGKFESILYTAEPLNHPLPDVITDISGKDGIYAISLSSDFLLKVRNLSNLSRVIRMRFFVKPVGQKVRITVFLPANQVYEYYSRLYDTAREVGTNLVIRHLLPYTPDVWDFL